MWRITLKSLMARKLRLVTTSIAIILGVAFVAGTLVLTATINKSFNNLFGTVYENVDGVVRGPEVVQSSSANSSGRSRVPNSLINTIVAVDGVEKADGFNQGYAQLIGKDGKAVGDPAQGAPTFGGTWSDDHDFNPFKLRDGHGSNAPDEMVIDAATAEKTGYVVGDRIKVLLTGGVEEFTLTGIATFGDADSILGSQYSMFAKETSQRLFGLPGEVDEIDIVAKPGVSEQELVERVRAAVPSSVEVATGDTVVKENESDIKDGLKFISWILLGFAGISLFVGAFIINNTFTILIAQRMREMALLRAVGASRRQVMRSVLLEAITVGILGSLVGVGIGILIAWGAKVGLGAIGLDLPGNGLAIGANVFIVALLVGVVVSLLSAILPARRASRIPPIAAMRDSALDVTSRSIKRAVFGTITFVGGVVALLVGLYVGVSKPVIYVGLGVFFSLIGVIALGPIYSRPLAWLIGVPLPKLKGITGDLARENAVRNPRRTASTASALMIGVALVTLITVFASSAKASVNKLIDQSFGSDFIISTALGTGGLAPELVGEVAALPGVDLATSLRTADTRLDGDAEFTAAIDPKPFASVFPFKSMEGDFDTLGVDELAVTKSMADDHGWKLGSTVSTQFIEGGPHAFKVTAIYELENDAIGVNSFITQSTLERYVSNTTNAQIWVTLDDDANPTSVSDALKGLVSDNPTAEVQDLSDIKETAASGINQLLMMMYVLLAVSIVIALFGIANTLALSVLERTREIGLLRAVGMTRRQARTAVRWESVIIALLGALSGMIFGVLLGVAFVRALADQGLDQVVIPGWTLLIIAVVAAIAGVVAAWLPARRAARLNVLDALATS